MLFFIVDKLQNTNAYAGSCRIGYTITGKVEKFEYSGQFHVIKVNSWGYARFAHHQVYFERNFWRVNTLNFAQIKMIQRFTLATATLK